MLLPFVKSVFFRVNSGGLIWIPISVFGRFKLELPKMTSELRENQQFTYVITVELAIYWSFELLKLHTLNRVGGIVAEYKFQHPLRQRRGAGI